MPETNVPRRLGGIGGAVCPFGEPGKGAYVRRRRAAATADQVEPSFGDKPLEDSGHHLRRLEVPAFLVGKPGVGHAGDGDGRELCIARMWSAINWGPVAQLRPM